MALTQQQKAKVALAAVVVQAVIAALTLRDLHRRSDDQVRGPRRLWQLVGTANTGGSIAYWVLGRKRNA